MKSALASVSVKRCRRCGKACYRSSSQAEAIARTRASNPGSLGAYRCRKGGAFWHIGHTMGNSPKIRKLGMVGS